MSAPDETGAEPELRRLIEIDGPLDLTRTMRRFQVLGSDPTLRTPRGGPFLWAMRTEDGAATLRYAAAPGGVEVSAWGPGARRAMAEAPDHVGAHDDPRAVEAAVASHPGLSELARRFPGIRFGRSAHIYERMAAVVLGQKVTGKNAQRSWAGLVRKYGEPAPGPFALSVPPPPELVARLPDYELRGLGIERMRGDVLKFVSREARALAKIAAMPAPKAERYLLSMRGIGPWTTGLTLAAVHGDPDAVAVGDYHLKNMVAFALVGEERATDERMLELLEPFRPARGRVVALLAASGIEAPRFGPRMPVQDLRRLGRR